MKTLKQIYREHGYAVNDDNQEGIGNQSLMAVEECFKEFLEEKLEDMGDAEYGPYSCDRCEAGQNKLEEIIKELNIS
jgi:hypothetical protein